MVHNCAIANVTQKAPHEIRLVLDNRKCEKNAEVFDYQKGIKIIYGTGKDDNIVFQQTRQRRLVLRLAMEGSFRKNWILENLGPEVQDE